MLATEGGVRGKTRAQVWSRRNYRHESCWRIAHHDSGFRAGVAQEIRGLAVARRGFVAFGRVAGKFRHYRHSLRSDSLPAQNLHECLHEDLEVERSEERRVGKEC